MISRFLVTACVLTAAACGGSEEGREIEYEAVAGEPISMELGGTVLVPEAPLPEGAAIVGERLEWTPSLHQEGEHVVSLDVVHGGFVEPTILRVTVTPGDPSIEYGGCECGSRPNPPRPKAEALGVLLLAAYFRQRRRSA